MEIHERLKMVRKAHSLTQNEFAAKLGVSRSVISNLELNLLAKPEQKIPLIKLIGREFSISEKWLLEGIEPMYTEIESNALMQVANLLDLDETEQKFLAAYLSLEPEVKESLKKACRQIIEFYKAQNENSATMTTHLAVNEKNMTMMEKKEIVSSASSSVSGMKPA